MLSAYCLISAYPLLSAYHANGFSYGLLSSYEKNCITRPDLRTRFGRVWSTCKLTRDGSCSVYAQTSHKRSPAAIYGKLNIAS